MANRAKLVLKNTVFMDDKMPVLNAIKSIL